MGQLASGRRRERNGDNGGSLVPRSGNCLLVKITDGFALKLITMRNVRAWLVRNGGRKCPRDASIYRYRGLDIHVPKRWTAEDSSRFLKRLELETGQSQLKLWGEITGHYVQIFRPIKVTANQHSWLKSIYACNVVDAWRVPPQAMEGLLSQGMLEIIERRRGKLARLTTRAETWLKEQNQ